MIFEILLALKLISLQARDLDLNSYPDLKLRVEEKAVEQPLKTAAEKPAAVVVAVSTPLVVGPAELQALFNKYASEYGVEAQTLAKIARCESGFNPEAVNGPYAGMYQFCASTWVSTRKSMNLDPDPKLRFNPEEAVKTTAFKISRQGVGAWPVCSQI